MKIPAKGAPRNSSVKSSSGWSRTPGALGMVSSHPQFLRNNGRAALDWTPPKMATPDSTRCWKHLLETPKITPSPLNSAWQSLNQTPGKAMAKPPQKSMRFRLSGRRERGRKKAKGCCCKATLKYRGNVHLLHSPSQKTLKTHFQTVIPPPHF